MDRFENFKQIIENHENRIVELEEKLSSTHSNQDIFDEIHSESPENIERVFHFLIFSGFFKNPKSINEIKSEIDEKGLSLKLSSIRKILNEKFLETEIIQKIPVDTKWKYVILK